MLQRFDFILADEVAVECTHSSDKTQNKDLEE